MWGRERERETSISLIFCLLNFHCVPGSTWGLPGASRCSSASSVRVIANPISSSPKSEGAKIPCALFKIPNEETHPSLLLSHYKVPTKKLKRSSQPTHKPTNRPTKKQTRPTKRGRWAIMEQIIVTQLMKK